MTIISVGPTDGNLPNLSAFNFEMPNNNSDIQPPSALEIDEVSNANYFYNYNQRKMYGKRQTINMSSNTHTGRSNQNVIMPTGDRWPPDEYHTMSSTIPQFYSPCSHSTLASPTSDTIRADTSSQQCTNSPQPSTSKDRDPPLRSDNLLIDLGYDSVAIERAIREDADLRDRRRLNNKLSAQAYRERCKRREFSLQETLQALENDNKRLSDQLLELKRQKGHLLHYLKDHLRINLPQTSDSDSDIVSD